MQKKDVTKQIEYFCEKGRNNICPFSNRKCPKINRSDLGVCSFVHQNKQQIICPNLFLKFDFISLIASEVLRTNNYCAKKEVKILNNFFDYILIDKDNTKNYCAVEVQALDTTGNYKWIYGEQVKPFCINWKTTKKTIISQLLEKVSIFRENNKQVVLVIQDTFFEYCRFSKNNFDSSKDFHVLVLNYANGTISKSGFYSYDYQDLLSLFKSEHTIDLDKIIYSLR